MAGGRLDGVEPGQGASRIICAIKQVWVSLSPTSLR